eukprot:Phypoly_transcript_23160.p1 GENE.Phypoly_transcript_23160~~Phypoly_transcript_23160.p1  ORF type:complete len:140 (+),score=10.67 Phypoly_transcript_23160:52-420(+)
MGYVLKMYKNTKVGDIDLYSLTEDGTQTKNGQAIPNLDMDKFWQEMGPTISSIIDNKTDGWDQVRIHYDFTSQPIFNIAVAQDGRSRSFGIYGEPYEGAQLEKNGGALPQIYIDLYSFMTKQ